MMPQGTLVDEVKTTNNARTNRVYVDPAAIKNENAGTGPDSRNVRPFCFNNHRALKTAQAQPVNGRTSPRFSVSDDASSGYFYCLRKEWTASPN